MGLVILAGDGAYEMSEIIKNQKADFLAKHPGGEVEYLDSEAADLTRLKTVLDSRSLFASNRLVFAEGYLLGQDVDEVEKLLEISRTDDLTELIVIEKSLDKRTKLYTWLKKQPEFKECSKLSSVKLTDWARGYAREIDLNINSDQIETVVRYSGEEQFSVKNNLDKLSLVGGEISLGVIKELVQDQSKASSFSLIEHAFRGDSAGTERAYKALIDQGEEPHAILGLLAWQVNLLAVASQVPKPDRREFAAEFKISDFAFSKAAALADQLSKQDIKELLEATAKLDVDSKSKSIDMERSLLAMLLKVAGKF